MKLSDSKTPAYHLRPNKAIDRLIFLELLRSIDQFYSLKNHIYIGFGGPFLDEFRLLAQLFPGLKSISIEKDKEIFKRQLFHRCSSQMEPMNCTFTDFLDNHFPSDYPVIIWADYTEMQRSCLLETADIAHRASLGSIYRLTLRAETPIRARFKYGPKIPVRAHNDFSDFVADYIKDMTIDGISYDPNLFTWGNFSDNNFPLLLAKMIHSILSGSSSHPKTFLPLHASKYSDGTIMLSITGMFCLQDETEKIIKHFNKNFPFYCGSDQLEEIDVPVLTTKERLALEHVLPNPNCTGDSCIDALGYLIEGDDSEVASLRKMNHYEKYYRFYPYFGKLSP
jgi:hypothetical protein